jgi:hypothetical protein
LASMRQSFLNGVLTRLLDPDTVLRHKIVEFVQNGDFGLASGQRDDGTYDRIWFAELLAPDEIAFESGVYLLTKAKAKAVKAGPTPFLSCHRSRCLVAQLYLATLNQRQRRHSSLVNHRLLKSKLYVCSECPGHAGS